MLDFNNTKNAFEDKNNFDLKRAYILFSTIKNPIISEKDKKNITFLNFTQKL